MYKLDYNYVTTAFYLLDRESKQQCIIKDAQIEVDNLSEPILFNDAGRLLPFYSEQHRKDGAMLVVDLDDSKGTANCDLQVVIMAKEKYLHKLTPETLSLISEQLEGVLKKNAGMIGKYFVPEYAGVRLQLSDKTNAQQLALLDQLGEKRDGRYVFLTIQQFSKINNINELDLSIVRITPWMRNNL